MCYNIGVLIIYKEGVNVAKKKTKREKKKGFAYSSELYGVIFLLAGIIGIGKYGPVGNLISSFAVFLVGVFYNILLVFKAIPQSKKKRPLMRSLRILMRVINQLTYPGLYYPCWVGLPGRLATAHSAVSMTEATPAAFCSADLVTFTGSIMPASYIESTHLRFLASNP